MDKKKGSTRQPLWWEPRTHGLEGKAVWDAETIAWIVPVPGPGNQWAARFVHHKEQLCASATLAREYADKILGNQVTWWIFRLEDNQRLHLAPKE